MLPQGMHAAAGTVGVALVLADIHYQPGIKCPAVQTIREAQLDPVRMLARNGVAARHDLRLNRSRHVHQMHAPPAWIRRSRCRSRLRSEEHTSELQSHVNLVCRLLLQK